MLQLQGTSATASASEKEARAVPAQTIQFFNSSILQPFNSSTLSDMSVARMRPKVEVPELTV
jgi:hypothetical protein